MTKGRDALTLDLFRDFEPKPVVDRFPEEQVRAATLRERVARAVSAALKAYDGEREAIAAEMSEYLGERVTKAMLDQYASQANAQHAIPAHRLIALAIGAGDARLINALLIDTGLVAVNAQYEPLIMREMANHAIKRLQRKAAASDAQWRAGR